MTMEEPKRTPLVVPFILATAVLVLTGAAAQAQTLAGAALVDALRDGGYVIAMRHAHAMSEPPGPQQRVPANVEGDRQLSQQGYDSMTAMRFAFRELGIPVGDVYSSPVFRALETAEHLGFGDLHRTPELGNEQPDADWLSNKAGEAPREGTNTVIVTHAGNLRGAFGDQASGVADGEALIFRADSGNATLVARVPIEQWPRLAID